MKKVLLTIAFLASSAILLGQMTHHPAVGGGYKHYKELSLIEDVAVSDSIIQVYINFLGYFRNAADYGLLFSNQTWISISETTTLNYIHPETGEEIKVPVSGGGCYQGEKVGLTKLIFGKQYNITDFGSSPYYPKIMLYFIHKLPEGLNSITIHENGGKGSFFWKNIKIRPVNYNWEPFNFGDNDALDDMIANSKSEHSGVYTNIEGKSSKLYAFFEMDDVYALVAYAKGSYGNIGDLIGTFSSTDSPVLFTGTWYDRTQQVTEKANLLIENGHLIIKRDDSEESFVRMKGLTKSSKDLSPSSPSNIWTGSGFALKDGYVITNHHVIDGAGKINIYGINGDFTNSTEATIIGSDKVNDLALLKIKDNGKPPFNDVPYSINLKMADAGEDIFVMGYPLTQLLGNEIKITNGIINSKTGFEGNVNNYQISAPVQPGNSGGPMFDKDGNVVGVIVAGVNSEIAQNANYAIKTSCIKNLIESVSDISILPKGNNILKDLSLPDQIKKLKDFVFYIECSK